jgi:phasin family protein
MFAKFQDLASESAFNLEAGLSFVNTVFASTERLAALNLETARKLLDQSIESVKTLQNAKDVQSFVSLQAAQTKPALDNVIAYSRSIYEIATETKDELAKIVEVQFTDAHAKVADIVDKALKSAPAGSESAVSAIRLAIDNANTAYSNMNKVAKQVAEIAEANMTAASDATLKAAASASKATKKAA